MTPHNVVDSYLSDFSAEEIYVRPAPGTNHLAWQIGHLLSTQHRIIDMLFPGRMPAMPAGFAEQHSKETNAIDNPNQFLTKDQYLAEIKRQRDGLLTLLESLSDEDLQAETPEAIRSFVATKGAAINFVAGAHWLWHAGQWIIARRNLNKPVLV
ncbi:MAG: DinB family protein [Planctomycetota bacterium]